MENVKEKSEIGQKEKGTKVRGIRQERNRVLNLTKAALMTALFCVLAPHTIYLPISPVGITLGTFLVYLTGFLLGPRLGSISILLYLLLGMVGLPVFSGYMCGAAVLFGPTGGYLIGYIFCGWIVGFLSGKGRGGKWLIVRFVFAAVLGAAALYLVGTVWFLLVYTKGTTVSDALAKCVIPFLPLESVKIVVSAVLASALQKVRREVKAGQGC